MPPESDRQCGRALGRCAWTGLQTTVCCAAYTALVKMGPFSASRNGPCDVGGVYQIVRYRKGVRRGGTSSPSTVLYEYIQYVVLLQSKHPTKIFDQKTSDTVPCSP